jgi:hypothetical protein
MFSRCSLHCSLFLQDIKALEAPRLAALSLAAPPDTVPSFIGSAALFKEFLSHEKAL